MLIRQQQQQQGERAAAGNAVPVYDLQSTQASFILSPPLPCLSGNGLHAACALSQELHALALFQPSNVLILSIYMHAQACRSCICLQMAETAMLVSCGRGWRTCRLCVQVYLPAQLVVVVTTNGNSGCSSHTRSS